VVGVAEYVRDYAWQVFDCVQCGCRFTRHDAAVYDLMHRSGMLPYYADYREMGERARSAFESRDKERLRQLLTASAKYRFVMVEIDRAPHEARLLEIGCSRGYLTAWFLLEGRTVLGVDASPEAVASAREAFGDHFVLADSAAVAAGAPYDIIYHVGAIGCVADPLGMTRHLLGMLRLGGMLLFNAPNRAALRSPDQCWFASAPPPDVVTLFPPGFWRERFAVEAVVDETYERCDSDTSFRLWLRRASSRALAISQGRGWTRLERAVCKVARLTRLAALAPGLPTEFGTHVKMVVRAGTHG
jgi:hypothetical protein